MDRTIQQILHVLCSATRN